ncbi:cyclohexanol dehydrogenase-like isoform X1 [Maniola jurtina]|uniref:cyclohexanol dehydrogenase-like isoform X1 n=1 Tax=Maniola jurtina TaxID=191418 RepID=UPI001E687FF3|nr:cyclohexanol dehydrogenase-like isoform X1 [Maniola jurtina]
MSFLNKVVIITGAGSGIGRANAVQFAKQSATLSLVDINGDNLHKVAEECRKLSKAKVLEVVADLSKDVDAKRAVDNTMKEFSKINVLVNVAGIFGDKGILDPDLLSVLDKVMSVNLRSTIAMVHYAAPALIESKGCVVNTASVMAKIVCKGSIPYNVSKAAIAYFTKNVAMDLADKGVRVNSISPGPVETNIALHAGISQEVNDAVFASYAKFVPLQHNIEATEVAEMAVYLASDKARSITGSDFVIDSGLALSGLASGNMLL